MTNCFVVTLSFVEVMRVAFGCELYCFLYCLEVWCSNACIAWRCNASCCFHICTWAVSRSWSSGLRGPFVWLLPGVVSTLAVAHGSRLFLPWLLWSSSSLPFLKILAWLWRVCLSLVWSSGLSIRKWLLFSLKLLVIHVGVVLFLCCVVAVGFC